MPYVPRAWFAIFGLDGNTQQLSCNMQYRIERDLFATSNIHSKANGIRRARREQIGLHDVSDVGEIACLLSIAKDDRPVLLKERGQKAGYHRRVVRVGVLTRAEDIEIPQRDGLNAVNRRKHPAQQLACELL